MIEVNEIVNEILWGPFMLLFFCGCGLILSVKTKFFQITRINLWFKSTLGSIFAKKKLQTKKDKHSISAFETFTAALAGTLGTGNIVGVATALSAGGPGAIFWMWVSAVLGMMTGYAENVLGIMYRRKDKNGAWLGGPMYYLQYGLKSKFLAVLFAFFAVLASFGMGNMAQSNSIAVSLNESFGVPLIATGVLCAIALLLIIMGGIKRIGAATSKLVPAMAVLYIIGCILILIKFRHNIPEAFLSIISSAFNAQSAAGGIGGYGVMRAMRFGVARGVFSNEAGLGSSVLIHSASEVTQPVEQGMWSISEVFVDTIVMCTLTALCILASGTLSLDVNGAALAVHTFKAGLGDLGTVFLGIAMPLFAFSTLLSWSYNGEQAICYLFGMKAKKIYKAIFIMLVPIGCLMQVSFVFNISDTFNGLMALPNLIGIMFLSGKVYRQTRLYLAQNKK